ncbi:UDP-N-acetylmuramate dehydrogenase [Hornefia butyriciproducens]|uniref:UDP-N-acetylmuramate dehydrogenase n=1 Tax=Hornefia butyriciproducens TaxID=2652293 RepID=UPI003F88A0A3
MRKLYDVDMREYTTFRAGGRAAEMVICDTAEELSETVLLLKREGKPCIMLGNGSNTLFTDRGYKGTVIRLGRDFRAVAVHGVSVVCGADVSVAAAAKAALAANLTGFEFASGIPGSIGGALFMDAGAYGGEMKDVVTEAQILRIGTGQVETVAAAEMELSYRHSIFQTSGDIILSVTLKLKPGDHDAIAAEMNELTRRRNAKQPVQYPSAGSFFKRPEGYFAGKLIQDAGLKGLSVGGAQVSEQHSGFIINKGNATADDIIRLMHLVQNTVKDKFGVVLEPEVRIIGD